MGYLRPLANAGGRLAYSGVSYYVDYGTSGPNVNPVTCSLGDNVPDTYDGRSGTVLQCSATVNGVTHNKMYICNDGFITDKPSLYCLPPADFIHTEVLRLTLGS